MKKILCLLATLTMIINLFVMPVQVKAVEEQALKSFEIVDFKNELEVKTKLDVKYELNKNVNIKFIRLNYTNEISICIDEDSLNQFIVDESLKWIDVYYDFLYLEIGYEVNDNLIWENYTSPQNVDKVKEYFKNSNYFEEPIIYTLDDCDYSFELLGATPDHEAPDLVNYSIRQDKDKLYFEFESNENLSGVYDALVQFDEVSFSFTHFKKTGNKYSQETIIPQEYYFQKTNNKELKLLSIKLRDHIFNEKVYSDNLKSSIVLDSKDNVMNGLDKDEIILDTYYADGKIYVRKDNPEVGRTDVKVMCKDSRGELQKVKHIYGHNNFDVSEVGTQDYEVSFDRTRYVDGKVFTETLTYTLDLEVVEVEGTIVEEDHVKEVAIKYDERILNTNFGLNLQRQQNITVLKDGEYLTVPVLFADEGGSGSGTDEEGGKVVKVGGYYVYNPKYQFADGHDNWYGGINFTNIYHLVDNDGNLVNEHGTVLVKRENRQTWYYLTSNDGVAVNSLYGALPSYTKVTATENNQLGDVFKNQEYVAYDINLEADHQHVQPVEDVTVSIDLPQELTNKEVDVYYVTEDGQKELIDSKVENGKAVFETNHFSTYAVVERKESEIVDKTKLVTAIEESESVKEEDFTAESYANFQKVLAKAKDVYADEYATQKEVDEVTVALKAAMEQLIKVDNKTPDTSDNAMIEVFSIVCLISLIGCVLFTRKRKEI